ncbi:glucoamylase family protein [Halomontanus rarus]|uniref:glucoamylase family protein n=1 Tax=Halomontanus rarus TaxID=3034020 RepID=UPI0023E75DE1|nr:glucoamylase family protein [Halovivax sp. TS33]
MTTHSQTRRDVLKSASISSIGLAVGTGNVLARDGREGNRSSADLEETLHTIATNTWGFFDAFSADETGLVPDRVDVTEAGYESQVNTSPANIGVQLLSTVAATNLEIIDRSKGVTHVRTILETLEDLERWNGHFYRWYDVQTGSIHDDFGGWWEISSIDNGWLSAGLVTAASAFPEAREQAESLLLAQDYDLLYNPEVYNPFEDGETLGHIRGGYDARTDEPLGFDYGMFNSETRIISYIGIGKGDIPRSHWWDPFRTFPAEWDQNQEPDGEFRTYEGNRVWEGHYEHEGTRYVPSWGGSMFESLMPSLVLSEREVGREGLGKNNDRQVQLQIEHAAENDYEAWGFSPCATPDGYAEFAVDHAGTEGYERDDFASPHATFLGLEYADESDFESALSSYLDRGLGTEYGLYDSMSLVDERVTEAYLSLDQAMILVAIANYLTDGSVRRDFRQHSVGSRPIDLLAKERLTI